MNRRRFLQSVAAVFALPALPTSTIQVVASGAPTAMAVPAKARSWAVYMSALHGECTPQSLQNLLNIPAADAKRYVTQLVADGVIKAKPLVQTSVSRIMEGDESNILGNAKNRLNKNAQSDSGEVGPDDSRVMIDSSELENEVAVVHIEVASDTDAEKELDEVEASRRSGDADQPHRGIFPDN